MRLFVLAFLLSLSVIASWLPAAAQQIPCRPFPDMKRALVDQFQEREAAVGQINGQQIVVLFSSEGGKTWTMVTVNTGGMACVIGAGAHWTPADRGA